MLPTKAHENSRHSIDGAAVSDISKERGPINESVVLRRKQI